MTFNDIGKELYATYRLLADAEAEARLTKMSMESLEESIAARVLMSGQEFKNEAMRKAAVTLACDGDKSLLKLREQYTEALKRQLQLKGEIDANEALRRGMEYTLLEAHQRVSTGGVSVELAQKIVKEEVIPPVQAKVPVIVKNSEYSYERDEFFLPGPK